MRRGSEKKAGKKKRSRRSWLRLLGYLAAVGVALGVLGGAVVAGMFYYFGSDPSLPRIKSVHDYKPKVVTRILDRNRVLIGEISAERRTVVAFDKIPKVLVQAVVAAEDADFFKHRGLDYMGMFRAFVANLRAGRFAQGGSTITQQVVKTFFLNPRRTIKRKMQEVILARRLESELTKNEILHLYLNQIYFGHGRYGVQEASRFFFGKAVSELNLAEAAMLAGLPQSPERLSPLKHPQRAKQRQRYVLGEMARHGYISSDVQRTVSSEPIRVVRQVRKHYNTAPEINDLVRGRLAEAFGADKLRTLGLEVQTTVDVELQQAAREAVQAGLREIDARQGYRKPLRRLRGRSRARARAALKRRHKRIYTGNNYRGVVLAVDDAKEQLTVDLGPRQVTVELDDERYNPQHHVPSKRFAVGDLIRVHAGQHGFAFDPGPQAALVAIDPRSGEVLAMVGGYDYHPGDFNRATRAERQPGSAFKPFVYGAALQSRRYTAATIVDDAPVVYKGWEPRNFDGKNRGPLRLRVGLTHSINTIAAKLIADIGVDTVRDVARRLGITSELGEDLSLALGSSAVKVIDMAAAFAGIAAGGRRLEPRLITRIGSETIERAEGEQVLSPEAAFVLASMMQSVVQEGTGRRARRLQRPAAGKTGTTNEQKDAWFVGFTPQLAAAVWVGFDTPRTLGAKETGSRAALPIWLRFMERALKGQPKVSFRQPPGVVVEAIDPATGLLAPAGATDALQEYFIAGTEPKEYAPSPGEVDPDTILMDTAVP